MADVDELERIIEAAVRSKLAAEYAGQEVTISNDGLVDGEKTITV